MSHVPTRYHGLWQRSLYAEPAEGAPVFADRDTQVFWLQAGDWHADLRVPADRPDFAGVATLADCDRAQLVWLARQTAFAGITCVEGRFCTWHRLVDLAPTLDKDIGEMRFIDENTLEECHPRGLYRELWQRVTLAHTVAPRAHFDETGLPRWLEYGDHAMAITPRVALDSAHELLAGAETLSKTSLRARAAVEVSLAHRTPAGWHVRLSTWPWREDQSTRDPSRASSGV